MLLRKPRSAQRNLHVKHFEQKISYLKNPRPFWHICYAHFLNSCTQLHQLDMAIISMVLWRLSLLCDTYCLWCPHTRELCFECKLQSGRKKSAWRLGVSVLKNKKERKQNSNSSRRGCEILNFGQYLGPQSQWQNSCASCSRCWISLFCIFLIRVKMFRNKIMTTWIFCCTLSYKLWPSAA